jgi:hypothetical protein
MRNPPDPALSNERRQIPVPLRIPRQQGDRVAVYLQLRTDYRLHTHLLGGQREADDSAQIDMVRQPERTISHGCGPLDERLGREHPIAERKRGMRTQFDERQLARTPEEKRIRAVFRTQVPRPARSVT